MRSVENVAGIDVHKMMLVVVVGTSQWQTVVNQRTKSSRSGDPLAARKQARDAGDKIARPTRPEMGLPLSCRAPVVIRPLSFPGVWDYTSPSSARGRKLDSSLVTAFHLGRVIQCLIAWTSK